MAEVEITQADREAAAPFNEAMGLMPKSLARGDFDSDPLIQAFARHRARTPLPQADREGGWQPIETAKKDGMPVRLYDPEYDKGADNFGSSWDGHWTDCTEDTGEPGWDAAVWSNDQDCWFRVTINPTHWMPLPPPPTLKAHPNGD